MVYKTKHTSRMTMIFSAGLLGLAALRAMPAHSQPAIVDGAFSTPNYVGTSPGWAYLNGEQGGWNFYSNSGNNSGISDNINNWFLGTPPVGEQAAFLQRAGEVSQTISNIAPGQDYQISFYAADRPNFHTDPITIDINGIEIGYDNPLSTSFIQYTTQPFYTPGNSVTLSFVGVDIPCTPYATSCDWDSAINDVVISPVSPSSSSSTTTAIEIDEPSGFAILISGLFLLLMFRNAKLKWMFGGGAI